MNLIFSKTYFASATYLAIFSTNILDLVHGRDVHHDVTKKCLPSAPTICISEKTTLTPSQEYTCPDLPDTSTCGYTGVGVGGYDWEFVYDTQSVNTASIVKVIIEEDLATCTVSTGAGETCNSCSVCAVGESSAIDFDCTNLADGTAASCASLDPFLYPFELGAAAVSSPVSPPSSAASNLALGSLILSQVLVVLAL